MRRLSYLLSSLGIMGYGLVERALGDSLGTMAGNLNVPINVARHFFVGGSYVLGAAFLVTAFARYMRFRQNPNESPISMVIILFLIGVVLILLPFTGKLSHHFATEQGIGDVVEPYA